MNYNLEKNNNSKKTIIGVSIIFCALILIIGATTAFFTQSDTKNTGNIVATDINGSIGYDDSNNPYMRQGLIPAKEEISLQAFNLDKNGKSNLKTIGDGAFRENDIQSIAIPASVETIEEYAFYMNKNLTTLTFEENSSLKTIEDSAFLFLQFNIY